jgi:hypothetical protein
MYPKTQGNIPEDLNMVVRTSNSALYEGYSINKWSPAIPSIANYTFK